MITDNLLFYYNLHPDVVNPVFSITYLLPKWQDYIVIEICILYISNFTKPKITSWTEKLRRLFWKTII